MYLPIMLLGGVQEVSRQVLQQFTTLVVSNLIRTILVFDLILCKFYSNHCTQANVRNLRK